MKKPLVTAILPVYNVEKYLKKSVMSLINQSYKNIEIIIVNDGSTDGSLCVAKELANKFSNVFVYSQSNSGAGIARNYGILKARGKYPYFLDPDDWIKKDYINNMVENAETNDSELVISGFTNLFYRKGKKIKIPVHVESKNFKIKKDFRECAVEYLNNTTLAVPWNKLYLSTFIKNNNLKFPKIKWDDLHFNLEVIKSVSKVSVLDNIDYQFFRNRPGSETSKVFDNKLFSSRKAQFNHVLEIFLNWNLEKEKIGLIYYYFCSRMVEVTQKIVSEKNFTSKEKRKLIKKILNDKLVKESLKKQSGGRPLMEIMIASLKTGNITIIIILNTLIGIIKKYFLYIFLSIKKSSMKV
jgi:glycosyltransferase involved in cell wall biosynthesis